MLKKNTWYVLLLLSFISTSLSANTFTIDNLRQTLPADTDLLELEDSLQTFPALIQAAVKEEPLGGILLLTDTESQQQWLDQSHRIRIYLAQHGWKTLTLPLPPRPMRKPDDSDEAFEENQAQYQSQIIERIQLGLTQLEEERSIIIAMGRSAEWASLVMQEADPSLRLLMINPRPADDQFPMRFLENLSALDTTIIDLYREPYRAGKVALPSARMRSNAMIQAGNHRFHQQRIKDDIWGSEADWLKRQIRGVISTYILAADQKQEQEQATEEEVDELPPGVRN